VFPVADRLTYYNESLQCGSVIDYFLTSNLKDTIAFNILDLDINLSDHRPIMAVCVYCDNTCKPVSTTGSCGHLRTARLRCDHAPIDKYYAQTHVLLQPLLDDVNALIDSSSWMDCQSTTDCADHIYEGVVDALRLSAHMFIPK